MANKKTTAEWQAQQGMNDAGFHIRGQYDRGAIRMHNSDETLEHYLTKALVGLKIAQARDSKTAFDTEVKFTEADGSEGVADVVDLGPPDGKPTVTEIQTDMDDNTIEEKRRRSLEAGARECFVLDPQAVFEGVDIETALERAGINVIG